VVPLAPPLPLDEELAELELLLPEELAAVAELLSVVEPEEVPVEELAVALETVLAMLEPVLPLVLVDVEELEELALPLELIAEAVLDGPDPELEETVATPLEDEAVDVTADPEL
jgi:hypothetical protein